ncbi:MAG: TatD family hydrolase [Candidatus Woesearchaeota archaeon]
MGAKKGIAPYKMSLFVDVHCHLDLLLDIDSVIARASSAGLKVIIAAGVDPVSNRKVLELAARFPLVKASLGLYPIDALVNEVATGEFHAHPIGFDIDEEIGFMRKNSAKIIAIGEAGLDYKTGKNKEEQRGLFEKQIELAKSLDKPIIVHSRKAEAECVEMLESSGIKKVLLHCFCGSKALVKRAYSNGWYFSVPTNVVRSEQFQIMVKSVDISHLLTETDAPCLSPFKGQSNEPAFIVEAVKKIAELKGMDQTEAGNIVFMNYERLFL